MQQSTKSLSPIIDDDIDIKSFDAFLLPGGSAQGMKPYMESKHLQELIAEHFRSHCARIARNT